MIPLRRVPIWTNRRRSRFLRHFRDGIDAYFRDVRYEAFPFRIVESGPTVALRRALESDLERCRLAVSATERVSALRLAPGDREGEVVRVNLITEAFGLHRFDLRQEDLMEVLDAACRAYDDDRTAAWVRTANPLYWLDMALSIAEVLPFLPLAWVHLDWRRAARSPLGRGVRVLLRAAVIAGLVVGILWVTGLEGAALDTAEHLVHQAMGLSAPLRGS